MSLRHVSEDFEENVQAGEFISYRGVNRGYIDAVFYF